ncbi:transglycosylase family protein [Candidatus Saccharibacteria bacterium]|nr:transglycosylase family protein [Candidatus Saccharibacteria bacterium]
MDGQVTAGQPVPVPDDPEEPALPEPLIAAAPSVVPGLPGPGPQVQSLLIKQVRSQIVLYRKSTWRWERLMGLRVSPGGNLWSIGSLPSANKQLAIWKARSKQRHETARDWMRQRIEQYRQEANHMSQVMGTRPVRMLLDTSNLELRFVRSRRSWRSVQQHFSHPPYQAQFMCIHFNPRVGHGEGPWDANTGNGYFGGLQMDRVFMSSYGAYLMRVKGTADRWTWLEQIWTAGKAVLSRGFHPWPNTARSCGLLGSREV